MNNKRRRNRVQGGWGSSSSTRKIEDRKEEQINTHYSSLAANQFSYEPTIEANLIKSKPLDLTYENSGEYNLSSTKNGVSSVELINEFIKPSECEWIFQHLLDQVPWKQEYIVIKGERKPQPRLTCWYGDIDYTYSGLTLKPHPFSPVLIMLREQIEKKTNLFFNSMLANLYQNGKDSVDWHSDDEPSLGENPVIASLTFGDTRVFEMREKNEGDDYSLSQHVKIPLPKGSLLVMSGAVQKDWQHCVPKSYHDRNARVNLTFRYIYPN